MVIFFYYGVVAYHSVIPYHGVFLYHFVVLYHGVVPFYGVFSYYVAAASSRDLGKQLLAPVQAPAVGSSAADLRRVRARLTFEEDEAPLVAPSCCRSYESD